MLKEAMFYKLKNDNIIECELCPHHCLLKSGQLGICRVRRNEAGKLVTLNYANVSALALDPIEKKPLYHFYPGKMILSAGTYGCNLSCGFCQNYNIAHELDNGRFISTEEMLETCLRVRGEDSIGLAFTYNEPSIWYEYIIELSEMLSFAEQKVVLISNGYIETKPLEMLLPNIDAMNIDLKSFSDRFYRKNCGGKLEPVKKVIEKAAEQIHLELTTLIITEENDTVEEISELARWVAAVNPDIPLHLSRYHPAYKFTNEATSVETMELAYETAREHLNFVYLGNLPRTDNNTVCKKCNSVLIRRNAYQIKIEKLKKGQCTNCGSYIDYIVS
ncbi:MAG TPA: AmmeMemoRadiSam system radical SAM enzyme [Syntrophomonadaceae bacterium]|nr:AmmeMemoRadiSam system radical SAM enzyme [Syntrophomonadaceae bacterium]